MNILKSLAMLLSAALTSSAALVYFDISPAGSDVAVGLSPSNTVPKAILSQGSGGEISGGIVFDTDTSILQLAAGYGSAAGFSDLTGPAIKIHIQGPAMSGETNSAIVDLQPFSFPAAIPKDGGVIFGTFLWPTNYTVTLLGGKTYLNILTEKYEFGEIRGQLIPTNPPNAAPVVSCPDAATVECSTPAEVGIAVNDPDGDALTVVWTVNGSAVQTNRVPASNPPGATNVSFVADLPLGTNVVGVTVTDTAGNAASCSTTITVVDTKPPVIDSAGVQPTTLWPPNHKMVPVTVSARVMDRCGAATWKIIDVRSNEPVNGRGDGNTSPDWEIVGDNTVLLRAERSGNGDSRIYTITVQAKDGSGNLSIPKTVTVTVPKSEGEDLGVPGAVALLTPTNSAILSNRQPEFTWSQSSPAATWFQLCVTRNGSKYLDQWIRGATNWTPTVNLPGGSYSWRVQTYNSEGLGAWSTNAAFTIPVAIPTKIVLVSPIGSAVAATTQLYTWQADVAASWYNLYILQNGKVLCDKWFRLSDSVAQSGSGDFAVKIGGHTGTNYQWYVRGWSPDGLGPWSNPGSYTMNPPPPPGPVMLLTPTNNATAALRMTEFTWTASSPAADWYYLYVVRNGTRFLDQWVAGTTNWVVTNGLPGGTYTWWVLPWNAVGPGPWSTNFTFTIQPAVPCSITLKQPDLTPQPPGTLRYTWRSDPAATWYQLYVVQSGRVLCDKWFNSSISVVDSATGDFAVDVNGHTNGGYDWWVRGWGPDGLGTWSTNLTFQIP